MVADCWVLYGLLAVPSGRDGKCSSDGGEAATIH